VRVGWFDEVWLLVEQLTPYAAVIIRRMKAHVYVTLKRTVLDPQGQTIHGALKRMQYMGIEEVRQGK
jgi:hypothetical protein